MQYLYNQLVVNGLNTTQKWINAMNICILTVNKKINTVL